MDQTPAISFILGTGPEAIKCSPLLGACETHGIPFNVIHTGQHYDDELDDVFFDL
jgi:UDP-N-acetylglucosamine 2-epimerase (non-hydrolysing)